MSASVVAIYICPVAGEKMQLVDSVEAIAGRGLAGDRYCNGVGCFSHKQGGNRQVTLINGIFFERSLFAYGDSRRNIVTRDIELMALIGEYFEIGTTLFRGVRYCKPCNRPSDLIKSKESFRDVFRDCGGLVAEVSGNGIIKTGDSISLIRSSNY